MIWEILIAAIVLTVVAQALVQLYRRRSSLRKETQPSAEKVILTSCAWCNKFRTPEGVWTTNLEQFQSTTPAFSSSHAICPDCQKQMTRAIDLPYSQETKSDRTPPSFPE